jgi:hypothetical protein
MKRLRVLLFVLPTLFLHLQVQQSGAESACVPYQFRPQGLPLSVTFLTTPPNCRSVKYAATADSTNWRGQHVSDDSFSAELSMERSTATQIVVALRPKGWTVGAEETLNDRERLATWMLNMLLPGEKSHSWELLSHYVRVTIDGLPGVEFGGTVSADVGAGSGEDRERFVLAFVIVDQRRNLAYIAAYRLDAPGAGLMRVGFMFTEQAFRFLDSFHVDR